jgi:hypothetical protein
MIINGVQAIINDPQIQQGVMALSGLSVLVGSIAHLIGKNKRGDWS